MILLRVLCYSLAALIAQGKPFDDPVCGYDACPDYDPNALNVHLIPHSHDDVGWLRNVDQYFFESVDHVISTVVIALKQNPKRRFVQVETAFFKKWWEIQPEEFRQDLRDLVNNGQFELINGAWSMNDEACVQYQSTIDQFTLGLRYLEDNLGPCARPRVSWQIDPFGHSREHASLSAQMGFDGVFFARLDYRDKNRRLGDKTMDLLWRGSNNLGNSSDIFTNAFYNHYSAPGGYCFDIQCADDPIVVDEDSPEYNYEYKITGFAIYIRQQASSYATNNILIPLGDDFRYTAALKTYVNTDLLINGFDIWPQTSQDGKPIKVYYSSPSCYAKAVNEFANTNNYNLELKTDDFFPYADGENSVWSAYFTSRPASKLQIVLAQRYSQVAKQLGAATGRSWENEVINALKEQVGVLQHHDAITGTEEQLVTDDYHRRLYEIWKNVDKESDRMLSALISGGEDFDSFGLNTCFFANITSCPESSSDSFTVVVYNPLSRNVSTAILLPVSALNWDIRDPKGNRALYQVHNPIADFTKADNVPLQPYSLEFLAEEVPPLGFSVYRFRKSDFVRHFIENGFSPLVGYPGTHFEIDDDSGLLTSLTMNGVTLNLTQDFLYYKSGDGSSAYVFRPEDNTATRIASGPVGVTPFNGDVYQGVLQDFGWAKQVIKIYNHDRNFVEFEWVIGPIDVSDGGREVVTRYSSKLDTRYSFYTDANGREMITRIRNFRPDYQYTNQQPVAGNYYPVTSRIVIKDEEEDIELAVLNDRPQAGGSLQDGEIELMISRAITSGDVFGVNEQEYGQNMLVRGKHYLVLGTISRGNEEKSLAAVERDLAQKNFLAPWTFITNKDVSASLNNLQWSNLKADLPGNVQILTLEPWRDGTLLLRLEHILEKDEDENLSKEVTVDLSDLFTEFTITELQETTLAANVPLEESQRLHWPGSEEIDGTSEVLKVENRIKRDVDDLQITLAPMQIRTFWAKIN